MKTNLLDLYEQASDWTLGKVQAPPRSSMTRRRATRGMCATS